MSKILITGGCGFIGSHLVNLLDKSEHDILVIDNLSTGKVENLESSNIQIKKVDITHSHEVYSLITQFQPDTIVHLAAIASVQRSIQEPEYTHDVNFKASIHLLECAIKNNVKYFYFASSAAVYGNKDSQRVSEDSHIEPLSNYGLDKYEVESSLMKAINNERIKGCAFRFFNVFGPKQEPNSPYSGVVSIFTNRIIKGENLIIYGDGEQSRDFVFVEDVVQFIEHVMNKDISGEVFNVGTGESISLNQLIKTLSDITNKKVNIQYEKERNGDIKHSICDNSKVLETGYTFQYNAQTGLTKLIESSK
jgi:UDP-glucose 4-epimerase